MEGVAAEEEEAAIQFRGDAVVIVDGLEVFGGQLADEVAGAVGETVFDVVVVALEKGLHMGAEDDLFFRPEMALKQKPRLIEEFPVALLGDAGAVAQGELLGVGEFGDEAGGAFHEHFLVAAFGDVRVGGGGRRGGFVEAFAGVEGEGVEAGGEGGGAFFLRGVSAGAPSSDSWR